MVLGALHSQKKKEIEKIEICYNLLNRPVFLIAHNTFKQSFLKNQFERQKKCT